MTQYLTIHVRSFRSKKKKENYLAEQILQKDHRLLPSIKCDESNTNARTLLHACQRFQSLSIFPADATTCHNLATREDSRSKTPRGDPRQVSQLKLHDDSRGKWATYSTCSPRSAVIIAPVIHRVIVSRRRELAERLEKPTRKQEAAQSRRQQLLLVERVSRPRVTLANFEDTVTR